ncbi:hypothetical protein BGZ93_003296 [Podila epicladia]|nr:hypothetical protein BGZ92_010857 [Podila epicladia]KAG0097173.1 hypothetical protein BGZ93_003296 [Podila epicladia]
MTDNHMSLFCLVDGESTASVFPVKLSLDDSIGDLKDLIKTKKSPEFDDVAADKLTLWRVSIPITEDEIPILLNNVADTDKKKLSPATRLSKLCPEELPEEMVHIIVQRPPQNPHYLPQKKRIRIQENWQPFTASDGNPVDLPPSWIDILASTELEPKPRIAFDHLKNNLRAGDEISIPSLGQIPKDFGLHGQGHRLFVTEQMLELWEDMRDDKGRTYRRVLSGPMGVGKSYLSYFLAAKAYAEGWLVLYVSDAGDLDTKSEEQSTLEVVKRFLALNKDILTGTELEMLVNDYDGKDHISTSAVYIIFLCLLKSRDRKTLLLVDEHGKLFQNVPYVPDKFKSLSHLSSFSKWGETAKGSRVIFTGTAHAKYEMTVLEESYRRASVVFVGPLSKIVFSNLLATYPRLNSSAIKGEVTQITNCVPRELVYLSAKVEQLPDPISLVDLQNWTESRTKEFLLTAKSYYESRTPFRKNDFYKALLQTFLGGTSTVDFEWDFLDLGLIYRSNDVGQIRTQHHILCRPAQKALLELFKTLPLPEDTKRRIYLYGRNPTPISLDFSDYGTIQFGKASLGPGYGRVLTHGYEGYPRFDFMLGPMFIQVSISDFGQHNKKESADIRKAFSDRDSEGTNQIERYLNDLYGPGHSAMIEDNRFVVTKDGEPVPGFRVVYIRGSPGKPAHREWVNKLPDVLHITFEELKETLFKNIP